MQLIFYLLFFILTGFIVFFPHSKLTLSLLCNLVLFETVSCDVDRTRADSFIATVFHLFRDHGPDEWSPTSR